MRKSNSIRGVASLAVFLAFAPTVLLAQADPVDRPVSVSCVPGFSSNGPISYSTTTNFSLNIIGGLNRRVYGCEIGSVLNINKEEMVGFQISGVTNIVGTDLLGCHVAGVCNVVANHASYVQIAGVLNYANSNEGVQLSVINFSREITGAQVGVINVAHRITGAQVGVVNIAREMYGAPIGLVNLVANGQFHINVWADETALANVGVKMGSKRVYTVIAYGYKPIGEVATNKFGAGIGVHLPKNALFADIDYIHYNVAEDIIPFASEGNMLTKLRFTGGWQIGPKLAITAGPVISLWHSDTWNGEDARMFGLLLGDFDETDIWLGFSVGVQLL